MLVPHSFDNCSFGLSFEIGTCESSNFFLLFQDYFGYSRSLEIPYAFRIGFYLSVKQSITISIGIALNL